MTWKPFALVATAGLLFGAVSEEISGALRNRVDDSKRVVGMVVGTISPQGRSFAARGRLAKDRPDAVDADTVFEIGSISKVFTSLLLADMVERKEVTLDTPVASLLPPGVKIPERDGKQITLLDISMQVSGLPRMPNNFSPANPEDPYQDYTPAKLYEFLSGYQLTRGIGEKYEYSNLAVGLLGHALARKSGMSYEDLLRKRILTPLGMHDTSIALDDAHLRRLAIGHNPATNPVHNWNMDVLAGAGAIRSTANDLLKFLAANMELTESPLRPAMRRMRSQRRPTGVPDLDIMMAWHVWTKYGTEIIWHNGGTGGYRSFLGFDPAQKTGVVVLANTFVECDDIGLHALESKWPLAKLDARREHQAIAVDPKILQSYAGDFEFAPDFHIRVTIEDGHLFVQATKQPRFEAFPEKETEFFLKVVDAQMTFVKNDAGKVVEMILHQNGANPHGKKIGSGDQ